MKTERLVWILFIFLSLTWGSSFILMKKSLYPVNSDEMVLNPFQIGTLRIVLAALVLFPIALKNLKYLNRKTVGPLVVAGVCGNLIPAALFPLAETNIDSALAGMLNSSTSLFVVLIGLVFYKARPTGKQLVGLIMCLGGLFLVLRSYFNPDETRNAAYAFFIFPATLCYATSLTTIKFRLSHLPPNAITSLSFMLIGIPALIGALAFKAHEPLIYHPDGLKALGYLSILAIVGTALAVLLFTKLVIISNHIFSSAVAYMLPVVAVFTGVLDGEVFDPLNLIWVLVIISGVILMNRGGKNIKQKAINT